MDSDTFNERFEARMALEAQIRDQYKIEVNQIYLDNDKRSKVSGRRVRVLSITSKPGKAACASCDSEGKHLGKTVWISFERLANKRLFTRVA